MLQCTRTKPSMGIRAAGGSILHGTAQGILLIVVRGTDDVLRQVEWPIVLVPGLERNFCPSSAATQKGVKTVIAKNESSLDRGPFSVQLNRFNDMEHLDLTISK